MTGRRQQRRIKVTAIRRDQPDLKRLARVLIALAIAEEHRATGHDQAATLPVDPIATSNDKEAA